MTREIKFRFFSFKMFYGEQWVFDEYLPINDMFATLHSSGLIVMQYTGLKDKNGVEIYEGDVVATRLTDDNDRFVVTYEQKFAGWYVVRQTDGWREFLFGALGNVHSNEVIGNIYENPELLTA